MANIKIITPVILLLLSLNSIYPITEVSKKAYMETKKIIRFINNSSKTYSDVSTNK